MSIPLNDNILTKSPKSLDNRYLSNGLTAYSSVLAANSAIVSAYRHKGLKVRITISGEELEYWWKYGTTDSDLIPVKIDKFTLATNGSKVLTIGEFYTRILIKPSTTLTALKIGTTNGGDELLIESEVPSGSWFNLTLEKYVDSSTTLYFGGVSSSTDFRLYKD